MQNNRSFARDLKLIASLQTMLQAHLQVDIYHDSKAQYLLLWVGYMRE